MTNYELTKLTPKQALDALREAVETRSRDFVYDDTFRVHPDEHPSSLVCVYTREEEGELKGSCLVGTALIDILGADATKIDKLYGPAYMALDAYGIQDITVRQIFAEAQIRQDERMPWGDAYDAAERYALSAGVE